jgi:uncharacterized membrane protein
MSDQSNAIAECSSGLTLGFLATTVSALCWAFSGTESWALLLVVLSGLTGILAVVLAVRSCVKRRRADPNSLAGGAFGIAGILLSGLCLNIAVEHVREAADRAD